MMTTLPSETRTVQTIEPLTPQQIFFSFEGRIARRTWWLYGVLALLGLGVLLTVLLRVVGLSARTTDIAVNLALLWPSLAIGIKRWHDRDKSGWWMLVYLLPVLGWLWGLVENGFLRGSVGANRFGDEVTGQQ